MEGIQISNTTISDLPMINWLFEEAIKLQGKKGYIVWENIDNSSLKKDIDNHLQYKIISNDEVLGVFSIQYSDPLIWRNRDNDNTIYLHRIVVNPYFKGQWLFEKVLTWSIQFAKQNNKRYIRMDTWADNQQLIEYYKSFGFNFIENYKTSDSIELPLQNRNLNVALLEFITD